MQSNCVVYLFTGEYPYGSNESFLENEIPVLSKMFSSVFIFPHSSLKIQKRKTPENCFIQKAIDNRDDLSTNKYFFKKFFFICKILFTEIIHCPNPFYFLRNIRYYNSLLIRGIYDAEKIKEAIKLTQKPIIFYSYWMNDWALAHAVLKQKKVINNFVFRCAGYDIYDERHKGNFLPFRYFIYKNATAIYPNSLDGVNYIKKKMFPEKIKLQYWGTNDYGVNPFAPRALFTLVSCSNVIPLKRVELIIEILKYINFEMNWIHFGDGECLKQIEKLALQLSGNIHYSLKGRIPNIAINEFYKNNSVNLFITTSETESLPVSVQEAISFGIPVLATNVGGMAEIVNEQTGFLIDKTVYPKEVAQLIIDFRISTKNTIEFRKGVRAFWLNNFKAEENYYLFGQELMKAINDK